MSKRKPLNPTEIVQGWSLAFAMGMEGSIAIDKDGKHQPLLFGRIMDNLLNRPHTWNIAMVAVYRDPESGDNNFAIVRTIIKSKCTRTHLINVIDEFGYLVMDEYEEYKDWFYQIGWVASPGRFERDDLDIIRIMEDQIKIHELPKQDYDKIIEGSSITDHPDNPGIVPITYY